jgi:hypothetical protein
MGKTNHQPTKPPFPLGQVVTTPAAIDRMAQLGINGAELLARHQSGDWGDLTDADKQENEFSVPRHLRIFSSYGKEDGRIWVITEADRSATTLLLPESRRVVRELAGRKRATARAVEVLRPQYLRDTLGDCPRSGRPGGSGHGRLARSRSTASAAASPTPRTPSDPSRATSSSGRSGELLARWPRGRRSRSVAASKNAVDPRTDPGAHPMRWLDRIARASHRGTSDTPRVRVGEGMSRYAATCRRCGSADDFADPSCPYSIVVGWDRVRETYFAQVEDQSIVVPDDEDLAMSLVLWVGKWPNEVRTVDDLERELAPYGMIPADVRKQLVRDRVDHHLGLKT